MSKAVVDVCYGRLRRYRGRRSPPSSMLMEVVTSSLLARSTRTVNNTLPLNPRNEKEIRTLYIP